MPITAQLQRFVDDELLRAAPLAEETAALSLAQLKQPREGMLSKSEREHYYELVQALPKHKTAYVRTFSECLRQVVMADMLGTDTAPSPPVKARGLELMDEARIQEDIEISGAAQLISGSAEWEFRELQTFTATLAGQTHVTSDTNPLRPLAYARALWDAACAVTPLPVQRVILLRTSAGVMSGQLKKAWAAACTRLEAQGVEPGLYRTVVMPAGPMVHRASTHDLTQPGALEEILSSMPSAQPTSKGAATGPQARVIHAQSPAFELALNKLEGLLSSANKTGAAPPTSPQLREHRATLLASVPDTVDRQIVELLSRLFEAVLSDPRLPPAFRIVMARLQVSALRVALIDPTMVQAHDHVVWRLMNRIGSAAETYTRTTDPRWAALLAYCETLVDDIQRASVQDTHLYRLSLSRLDAFLGEQLREQQIRAQPTIDTLIRIEQREQLERQISHRLTEQMVPIRTAAGIRRFITGSWATVLAESMQRNGEKSETTLEYLRATDDLLWSLRLPDHPQSRKRLIAMLPGLLQRLRSGMGMLGVPEGEQQAVLDELMAVHAEALRPGKTGTPEAELSPQELMQRIRDETTTWDITSRQPFSDSLIDLSSMETVPAEILPGPLSTQDDAAHMVESMTLGSRHHAFLHGRWTRVQLLWRSGRGQYFLFAGTDPLQTHSITRRALERLGEERLMKPLDDVSLVQRSVDALMQKLTLSQ
ncbi:MAG: DUF1631 family protein [Burkholderiales bacterium]|jgi:hypothetical protein|nr:DUF1631 family protein [Burkholderiales bacterium]